MSSFCAAAALLTDSLSLSHCSNHQLMISITVSSSKNGTSIIICGYKVPGIILLIKLKGVMRLDRS